MVRLMGKRRYVFYIFYTLIFISPYLNLIMDIVIRDDYKKLLTDALFTGPGIVFAVLMWVFVKKINEMPSDLNNETLDNGCINKDESLN